MPRHTKKPQYWTSEQKKILIENYADSTPQQMIELLNGVFDMAQISKKAQRIGIRKSDDYKLREINKGRLPPGNIPWNTGQHYNAGGKAKDTQFKPGSTPPNTCAVGTQRVNDKGYIEIKIEEGEGRKKWKLLHREVWQRNHGKPPKGSIIIFKDHNKNNCAIENLQLITKEQLMLENSGHNYSEDLKEVMRLKAAITRKINRYAKRHH